MESELSVRDVLTTEYVGVSESDTVLDAVSVMRAERAGCVLVLRGSDPVGIMTEWDVLGVVEREADPAETTVGEIMSAPVLTIGADRSLADAANRMAREQIRNLVVENDDDLLGVLTQRDVIAVAGSFQAATANGPTDNPPLATTGEPMQASEYGTEEPDEYTTQGVCETCGTLADALQEINGRLVCTDCRQV